MTPTLVGAGKRVSALQCTVILTVAFHLLAFATVNASDIGREVAISKHLKDGDEFKIPIRDLLSHGEKIFAANWTIQEGAGRPLTKGTGNKLTDPKNPLVFPRNFNRVSGPDANSCAGCHNAPFGITGGGGDIVANVFVLGQRFDFAMFDPADLRPLRSSMDEKGKAATQESVGNSRSTVGMFGTGYIEMLSRQMTHELQTLRDKTKPGGSQPLTAKGISFGVIRRFVDGGWDSSEVEGIAAPSLESHGSSDPPDLCIRPFHQAGNVISLRQFSNNAFNHHHGIQSTEKFGIGTDVDRDGIKDELTRADVTAVTVFQATMSVPGRVIPNDPEIEKAVAMGEKLFEQVGCANCHIPKLPLDQKGWIYTEPNPFNPEKELLPEMVPVLSVDLNNENLPQPRLQPEKDTVWVPAYTDLKLHDLCNGPDDPNREPLDMNQPPGTPNFFAGNCKFITKRLWGCANEPPYFHHGRFTTMREAILAHGGEAKAVTDAYRGLGDHEQDCIIEFLKTLQVLPPGTKHLIVDERGKKKKWPRS